MSSSLYINQRTIVSRYESIIPRLYPEFKETYIDLLTNLNNPNLLDSLSNISIKDPSVGSALIVYCYSELYYEIMARMIRSHAQRFDDKDGILTLYSLARNAGLGNPDKCTSVIGLISNFVESKDFLSNKELSKDQNNLKLILISFYRLLNHSLPVFMKYIRLENLNIILNDESSLLENKYLAIEILTKALNYSNITREKMIEKYVGDFENSLVFSFEKFSQFNYKFLELFEAKRISKFLSLPQNIKEEDFENQVFFTQSDLDSNIRLVYGVLVPSPVSSNTFSTSILNSDSASLLHNFIPIESATDTLRGLTKKILLGKPVILYGGNGSGKSLIVNHLHSLIRPSNDELVTIHLNDQTDIKLLLGTYVSSHEPGKFVWKDGVLTNAVKKGKWLIIEDIDSAKNDILSIFTSLIEDGELTINGSEKVKVRNGFQIIATISGDVDTDNFTKLIESANTLKSRNISDSENFNYWKQILFENFEQEVEIDLDNILPDLIALNKFELVYHNTPTPNELVEILSFKYPGITENLPNEVFWQKLISLFYYMRFKVFNKKSFISMNNGLSLKKIDNFELIRLSNRINLLFLNDKSKFSTNFDGFMDNIFKEAIDVFCSSLQNDNIKNYLIGKIGLFLEISTTRINFHKDIDSTNNSPDLKLVNDNEIIIGRNKLMINDINANYHNLKKKKFTQVDNFAMTNHSMYILEKLSISLNLFEPVLLSGETGCGKTTVVQNFAKLLNKKLIVLNLSQETESNDLIGGYKPILNKLKSIAVNIHNEFLELFGSTFNLLKNESFLKLLSREFKNENFSNVSKLWKKAVGMAFDYLNKQKEKLKINDDNNDDGTAKKRRRLNDKLSLIRQWEKFQEQVLKFQVQLEKSKSGNGTGSLQFDFIEGSLVKAIKNGDWVLLDEVNLASGETLENISDLLSNEPKNRKLLLTEKASSDGEGGETVVAHKEFRLFACMNPSTDVGKKNLPENIRSRFNEIFVNSPDKNRNDLRSIVVKYLWNHLTDDDFSNNEIIDDIVNLYYDIKSLNDKNLLVDGSKNKIVVNIRVLSRALVFTTDIIKTYGVRRSLFEAFNMILLTLLDGESEKLLKPVIYKHTIGKAKNVNSIINRIPPKPRHLSDDKAIQFSYYWLEKGEFDIVEQPNYIITPFVEKNLLNLVRATLTKRFPILIQGPTSSGKTSMINYLAKITGNKVIRINNHEHTDLQEYLGSYVSDSETGALVFKHGPLIEALKRGYWIILDELNLASSEILEGINRLLDDNREIFLTETQELIKPHPNFLLFATQNPPGAVYGGRKFLSKAFKNRFLELNFDDIPQNELETILHNRCEIAESHAKKIVMVYQELIVQRSSNRIFESKNSFATLRDLFRWGSRPVIGYEQLAANGYMLLAEKNRKLEEKGIIKCAIEKIMRVKLDVESLYETKFNEIKNTLFNGEDQQVVWTKEMKKLAALIVDALANNENILLVGETGSGKTTVCNTLATNYYKQNFVFLNAHQNIETGDIIGSQRPLRNRSKLQQSLRVKIGEQLSKVNIPLDNSMDLNSLVDLYNDHKEEVQSTDEIEQLLKNLKILFEWSDGPLVNAMKAGEIFLFDEISLAEDSVLERLNSVLEPEKTLYLTEYSNDIDESLIRAREGFRFLATMNPGGDYGKKELSPALRNRFTEIYVPSMADFGDVGLIVNSKLHEPVKHLTDPIIKFSQWYSIKFSADSSSSNNGIISIRDILAWVDFINNVYESVGISSALLDGVCMVFVDALGTNNTAYLASDANRLKEVKIFCVEKLSEFSNLDLLEFYDKEVSVNLTTEKLSIGNYSFPRNSEIPFLKMSFNLQAPTTAINAMRVLRAMVIKKPILLEGDPGVGKSSLIDALAKSTNNKLTRINLSDQTDLVDLFGSDAPMEGGNFGEFVWKDAPFLRAMKCGEWVLLDEMNLASPSLLEALNSVFDFRKRVYIPELDQEFECHEDFRVFAAQNPQYQGGGRKGLPKSFINRFTNVYIGKLKENDMQMICKHIYPNIAESTLSNLIKFVAELEKQINIKKQWGSLGGPWEFNIRDIIKFLDVNSSNSLPLVFSQKFRSKKDKENINSVYQQIFGSLPPQDNSYYSDSKLIQVNESSIEKVENTSYAVQNELSVLQSNIPILESILTSVSKQFPVLLVGPTLSGKSEMIKFVANSVGAKLETVHIHNEIDITDLVGGLDQYHVSKEIAPLVSDITSYLVKLLTFDLEAVKAHSVCIFIDYLKSFKLEFEGEGGLGVLKELTDNLQSLSNILNDKNVLQFLTSLQGVENKGKRQFQFFDGILVDALTKGYWLHLSNINLVNSSIVDRLNSLTEANGVLVVTESSSIDGEPKVIKPHPNFRLFLSMDPKYGELSRAMRNRCVEIFVESFEDRGTDFDKLILGLKSELSLPITPVNEGIEGELSKLSVEVSNSGIKDTFCSSFVSSKYTVSKYLSLLLDIISHSTSSDVRYRVAHVIASFIPAIYHKDVFDFIKFTDATDMLSSQEQLILNESIQFLKFAEEFKFIPKSNALINLSSNVESISFNRIRFHYDFYEFVKIFRELSTDSAKYTLIKDIYKFLASSFDIPSDGKIDQVLSNVCICGILAIKMNEPERFNFVIQETQSLVYGLKDLNVGFAIDESSSLATFSVLNSDSMTKLWNNFVLLPNSLKKLVNILPPAWKSFVKLEYQNERISGVSLDLVKFKESQQINVESRGYFTNEFSSLLKLVESARSSSGNFNISDELLMLHLRSGKNIISLSDSYIGKLVKPFPAVLNDIYASETLGSSPFVSNVYSKVQRIDHIPGAEIRATVNDLKYLSSEILKNSSTLITDQLGYYRTILSVWLKEVIISQVVDCDEEIISVVEEVWKTGQFDNLLLCVGSNTKLANLKAIMESHFMAAFVALNGDSSFEKLGKAFIFFSAGLIQLFIPDAPYDPAICEFILYDIFCIKKSNLNSYKLAVESVRKILSGDKQIFFEVADNVQLAEVSKPRVKRPTEGSIKALFEDWSSFMDSSVGGAAVQKLIDAFGSETVSSKIASLHKSTERFLFNLAENFGSYNDLNSIYKGGILGLNFGFALTQMQTVKETRTDALSALNSIDTFLNYNKDPCSALIAYGYFVNNKIDNDYFSIVNDVVFQSFSKWKTDRVKKEQEEQAASNVYKFKGEEQEDPETAYKTLFPDYDEEDDNFEKSHLAYQDLQNAPFISTVFSNVMLSKYNESMLSVVDSINEKDLFVSALSGNATSSMITSLLNKLFKTVESYESQELNKTDFFYKPNIYQFSRCLSVVDDIRQEMNRLLEIWPENATIINILTACDELRTYNSTTTLARLIVKVEQILKFLDELIHYSTNLDKKLLNNFVGRITSMIVSWRQLELGSFNNMIINEHLLIENKLVESFYLLYELLVIGYAGGEKQVEEIVSLLNMFMSGATQGEFEGKLNLLKAFSQYIEQGFKKSTDLLDNMVKFYEQFLPTIQEHIETTKAKLTKDINEVILLASWKDVNIDALKESSKKSKRALYKVVKKYRFILNTGVLSMIENGLDYKLSKPEYGDVSFENIAIVKGIDLPFDSWKSQPKILSNLIQFVPKVIALRESLANEELPDLFAYCENILGEMDRLRKATPKTLTDENKKLVNSLKSEKSLLFSTVIKDLKEMGLKTQEVQRYKLTVTTILAQGNSLDLQDVNFFKILDLLPRLRNSVLNSAEDVPRDDAVKGLAIVEHLIFSLYSLRKPVTEMIAAKEELYSIMNILKKLGNLKDDIVSLPKKQTETTFIFVAKYLPGYVDLLLETITRASKISKASASKELVELLATIKSEVLDLYSSYDVEFFYTVKKQELITKFSSIIEGFKSNLVELSTKYPEYSFICDLLAGWLADVVVLKEEDLSYGNESLETVVNMMVDLNKSITVGLQKVKQLQSEEVTVDTDKYFLKSQQKIISYKNSLYFSQIMEKMARLIDTISTSKFDNLFTVITSYYLPLICEYSNITEIVTKKLVDNFYSVSKATYVLSTALFKLATDGFCSPAGASDQDDQKTDSGSGGGLGDGADADDKVNDDVDEEDLDEDDLVADKNEDKRDDDQPRDEEDDKAIDIEGDMEGENEDMEGQDDDENKEGNEEDLDEEIDDLDDLDPNAVDEKMWDEETQEDKKEKDSDNLPDNSKPDSDDLEAVDEDKMNSNDGEQQGEEEENENDEDASDEDDVGQQDDEVKHDENEKLEDNVDEVEALELPEELNLDNGEEQEEEVEDDKGFDDKDMNDNIDEEVDLAKEDQDSGAGTEEDEKMDEKGDDQMEKDSEAEKSDDNDEEMNDNDEEMNDIDENPEEGEREKDEEADTEMIEDEEGKDETTKNHEEEEGNEDNQHEDVGVDAIDNNVDDNDDIDADAAAKQADGEDMDGSEEVNDNAKTSGTSGSYHNQPEAEKKEDRSQKEMKEDTENEKLKESLKQLGDSLNDFHKKSEDILNSNETVEEEQTEDKHATNPDEFQHLDQDKDDAQQALGNADSDEVQAIDEDKQIEQESKDDDEKLEKEENEVSADSEKKNKEDEELHDKEDANMMMVDEELNTKETNTDKADEELIEDDNDDKDYDKINIEKEFEQEDDDEENILDVSSQSNIVDLERVGNSLESPISYEAAAELWRQSEFATNELSLLLCEQLRLILSPTISTKLKGDYKNGKRLNLKKIISYIASDFKKDKIWLKRTKPSKRNYQIMISIDDSRSMSENPETVKLTYNTISLVSKALTQLESGDLSIVKFGKDTSVIHNFNKKFDTKIDGPKCFQWFSFNDSVTNMKDLVENSIEIFNQNCSSSSNTDLYKLEIIISDGICENHSEISRLVRRAKEEKLLIVFVIIDGLNKNKESITNMNQVKYELDSIGNSRMKIDKYLNTFPFENYTIVNNINELPEMICQILRNFFMSSV